VLQVFLESLHQHLPQAQCTVFRIAAPYPPRRLRRLASFVEFTPALPFTPGSTGAPTWGEIASSLKPRVLLHLLRAGYQHVIYADADLWLLDAPASLIDALDGADVLFTPHAVALLDDGHSIDRDLLLVNAGVFNSGLVAVRNSDNAERFCAWWGERTETYRDRSHGRLRDQRWLNLAPYLFPRVGVVTDPGLNVGHWRIADAGDLNHRDGRFFLGAHAVSIMHMSGFEPATPETFSRHAPQLAAKSGSALRMLTDRYARCVLRSAE
jgi:Nucleotide-diphospho-sugar transferase